jgi:hypothetical protein
MPVQSANGAFFHDVPAKGKHSHIHDALQYAILGLGGADQVVVGRDRRRNCPRMAEGVDYDLFDHSAPVERVVWVNDRAVKQRRDRFASGLDYDVLG